jgi:hypothetical protein
MNGTVISYVYNPSDFYDMPREYRQHAVADINNADAITGQVKADRGNVPANLFLGWVR